jgi:type II secretory pathway component PulC
MKDNIPPEEKLLNLIRGPRKQDSGPAGKLSTDIRGEKKSDKISLYQFILKRASFTYIRKIVNLAFIVSCIYLAVSFIYPWVGLRKVNLPAVITHSNSALKTAQRVEVKPYEYYLEGVKGRQIFSSSSVGGGRAVSAPIEADTIKEINLVGIITGENPQAIIVDKKTQKTFYLNKGQSIGKFQVEEILEGKIILDSEGGRFELYL